MAQTEARKTTSDRYRAAHREECNERSRRYRADNLEKVAARDRAYRQAHLRQYMLATAKRRAQRSGLPFDITVDDIDIPEYCPILGLKLEMGKGTPKPNSPSLDKIVPELGYVPGNVQVISQRANVMKNDATAEELRAFAEWVNKQYG